MLWKEFNNGNSSSVAPLSDWTSMNRTDHFVQFYESDDFIVNSVAEYLFHGLKPNGNCICVATSEHNQQILVNLDKFGIDLEKVLRDGTLVIRDARIALSSFMRNGFPDPEKFERSIGTLVQTTLRRSGQLRIFGEMVSVLWNKENYEAAARLEDLWNKLMEKYDFPLFCAYPLRGFASSDSAEHVKRVCEGHSKTIPSEAYSSLTSAEERLRAVTYLQHRAEQLAAEVAQLKRLNRATPA